MTVVTWFALVTLILALVSVVGGAAGTIMSLHLYRDPTQHRFLTRPRTGFILSLLTGVLLGISEMLFLGFLWWLGLYTFSTVLAASIATAIFAAIGTYGGWTIGVKKFKRRIDG